MNKPACFGAVTVFSHDSKVCQQCQHFDQCSAASLQRLERIKAVVNVKDILAKHERAKKRKAVEQQKPRHIAPIPNSVTQPIVEPVERKTSVSRVQFEIDHETESVIARISNQKAAQQAVILCKANKIEAAREELSKGVNPFTECPKYLEVTGAMILEGGFTKTSLRERFEAEIGWKSTTAASHVSIVVSLLPTFNVIKQNGDDFTLNPIGSDE